LKAGVIAGIAVGALALIAAVIAVIVICKRRRGSGGDYDAGNVESAINADSDAAASSTIWGGDGGGAFGDRFGGADEQDDGLWT
jgi:hypothetical protein